MIDKSSIDGLEKESWKLKYLSEIATEIVLGHHVTKAELGIGDYPAIGRAEVLQFKGRFHIKECKNRVNVQSIKKPRFCKFGDLLLLQSCKRIENLGDSIVYLGNENPLIFDRVLKVSHNENPEWMTHLMSCEFIKKQIRSLVEDTVMVDLREKHLQQIKIPLPSRHIQNKVADFLCKFSKIQKLIEEKLSKELVQRKKQYEYYKETILSKVTSEWENVYLDRIAIEVTLGSEITKSHLGTGDYPTIKFVEGKSVFSLTHCQDFLNLSLIKSKTFCEYGDILIIKQNGIKEHVGKAVVYLGSDKPIIGSGILLIKHKQNGKFLSYILGSEFVRKQIQERVHGAIIMSIWKSDLQHIKIPLPPIEEQNRIVEVLDKLRTNIENLQSEIPLLIEDLKKQYIYYREQMLNPEIIN